MQKWIVRLSVRTLGSEISSQLLADISDNQKINFQEKKGKELIKALDNANLQKDGFETIIKIAEGGLQIKM